MIKYTVFIKYKVFYIIFLFLHKLKNQQCYWSLNLSTHKKHHYGEKKKIEHIFKTIFFSEKYIL